MTFFEWFYRTLIVQTVCVLLLLTGVIFAKYFWSETYIQIKDFYMEKIACDTKISEVFEGEI